MAETLLALAGGTVCPAPGQAAIADGVVLVDGERIAAVGPGAAVAIPPGATRIDCSGLTLCAGFWNSHVHFFERKWANAGALPAGELERQLEGMLTRYGFTSVFDTSSEWANTRSIRERIGAGEVAGPAIRSTGEGLIPRGGLPSDTVLAMMGVFKIAMREVSSEADAVAAARRLLDAGVDGIKIFASAPPRAGALPKSVLAAAITEAHRDGKPAFVHPNTAADLVTAVRAGVDIVAHTTPASGEWDQETLDAMAARGVALTPTLGLWQHYRRHERLSVQQRSVEMAAGQLRGWVGVGGEVLFGTDLGAVEYDPTPEYLLMGQAGMGFGQILASLTTAPSARFGDADGGRLAAGMRADIVAVEGDPAVDIRALARVRYTVRAGRVSYSSGRRSGG
jgi:imidazolonepropionase-like amidohydrolase